MADIDYQNGDDTYLRDIAGNPLTGAGHTAVTFTGVVGVDMAVDVGAQAIDFTSSPGECTVTDSAGTATYTAFKLADGVGLALVPTP